MDHGDGRPGTPGHQVWFLGDFDDPWVVALADALPAPWPSRRVHCPADLPDDPFGPNGPPGVIVLHRAVLTGHDAELVGRWRSRGPNPTRVLLCHGPHSRAVDLDRWSGLVDLLVGEATAGESIARHLGVRDRRAESVARRERPRVAVVGGHHAVRQMVAEAVETAGFSVTEARDWSQVPPDCPAVWDVPVLEPGWPEALARRARSGPVLALIGFADRELVRLAREHGASACLELPFDLDDLTLALERLTVPRPRTEQAHPTPPAPFSRKRAEAPPRLSETDRKA